MMLSQMGRSSRAAQKGGSGGHAAGGHYVEDAADVEIELLKEDTDDYTPAIVANGYEDQERKKAHRAAIMPLGFIPRHSRSRPQQPKSKGRKRPRKIFNI